MNFVVWKLLATLLQSQNKVMLDSQSLLLNGEHFAVQHYNQNFTFFHCGNAVQLLGKNFKEANDFLKVKK